MILLPTSVGMSTNLACYTTYDNSGKILDTGLGSIAKIGPIAETPDLN